VVRGSVCKGGVCSCRYVNVSVWDCLSLYGQLDAGFAVSDWLRASRCRAMQGQSFDGPVCQGYQPPDGSGAR
jgi:hypothetical protein